MGIRTDKREGDDATPAGTFALREVFYRPDRTARPATGLPVREITQPMGWCDDPARADYNRLIRHPYPGSFEHLWRDDHLYDLVVVIGYNDDPPIPHRGSAIFLHLPGEDATRGCVALAQDDWRTVLASCHPATQITIHPP